MSNQSKFSPEVYERAVRLVQEHRSGYLSLWATIEVHSAEDRLRAGHAAGLGQAQRDRQRHA